MAKSTGLDLDVPLREDIIADNAAIATVVCCGDRSRLCILAVSSPNASTSVAKRSLCRASSSTDLSDMKVLSSVEGRGVSARIVLGYVETESLVEVPRVQGGRRGRKRAKHRSYLT